MPEEKNETNKSASCNGFPKSVSSSIIKCALNKSIIDNHTDDDNNTIKFYLTLPYFGRAGEILVKKCIIRMLKKNIEKDARVSFVVTYNTTKLSFYTNTEDHIDELAHSYIAYQFCRPGCSKSYIGKT